ncbi:MAG: hypothetical protein ACQEXE_21960 [Bacillota bacterium]
MIYNKSEFEIGGNALVGVIVSAVTAAGAALTWKYMDDRKTLELVKADKPVKIKREAAFEIDPKTWKTKFSNKNEFEVPATKIKEVPVVQGFKKTKKVRVTLDKNGNEIPGTEEDIV